MLRGRLIGVGVGPGDPELLTLKAARAIERADAVAFIAAAGTSSRSRSIAAGHIRAGTREIALAVPMSGPRSQAAPVYRSLALAIAAELERGSTVVFLCEGDPLLYGSFIHLMAELDGRHSCEVIPGVAAMSAAAAAALAPLASRDEALAIIPATAGEDRLRAVLAAPEPVVVLKLGRHLAAVRRLVEEAGRTSGTIFVANASLPEQRVVPLSVLWMEEAPYFSMLLVGPRGVAP